jgi:hypothetical protein
VIDNIPELSKPRPLPCVFPQRLTPQIVWTATDRVVQIVNRRPKLLPDNHSPGYIHYDFIPFSRRLHADMMPSPLPEQPFYPYYTPMPATANKLTHHLATREKHTFLTA